MESDTGTELEGGDSARRYQRWHISGTPVVNNKYVDYETAEVKTLGRGEATMSGPPAIELFWHNRYVSEQPGSFTAISAHAFVSVTEYLSRLGDFLALGDCEVVSLNATRYAVYVTVQTELTTEALMERMQGSHIFPALELSQNKVNRLPGPD